MASTQLSLTQTGDAEVEPALGGWSVGHVKPEAEGHQQTGHSGITIAQQAVLEESSDTRAHTVKGRWEEFRDNEDNWQELGRSPPSLSLPSSCCSLDHHTLMVL